MARYTHGMLRDAVLLTKLHQSSISITTQLRFETSGLIVDTGMDDATVSTGLMARPAVFFFKDANTNTGFPFEQRPRYRKPNDAPTDYYAVEMLHTHLARKNRLG